MVGVRRGPPWASEPPKKGEASAREQRSSCCSIEATEVSSGTVASSWPRGDAVCTCGGCAEGGVCCCCCCSKPAVAASSPSTGTAPTFMFLALGSRGREGTGDGVTGAARMICPDLGDKRERRATGIVRKSAWADVPTAKKETGPFRRAGNRQAGVSMSIKLGVAQADHGQASARHTYIVVVRNAAPGDGVVGDRHGLPRE